MIMSNIFSDINKIIVLNASQDATDYLCPFSRMFLHFRVFGRSILTLLCQYLVLYGDLSKIMHWRGLNDLI